MELTGDVGDDCMSRLNTGPRKKVFTSKCKRKFRNGCVGSHGVLFRPVTKWNKCRFSASGNTFGFQPKIIGSIPISCNIDGEE